MTEQGGSDPNAPGWGAMPGYGGQQQPQGWGGAPQQGYNPPPPGYGGGYPVPPPYAYYGAPPTDGKAIGALVSSIVAWVMCPIVAAIVALVLASQSSRDIRNSGGRLQGEGFNTAARIISWINIVLAVLMIGLFIMIGATVDDSYDDYGYNETRVDSQYDAVPRVGAGARLVP